MDIPRGYREMETDPDAALYFAACEHEMASQRDCQSWELKDLCDLLKDKPHCNIITCRWVFDLKVSAQDGVNVLDRYKARLVAHGFKQNFGTDFFASYWGVTRVSTIRVLCAL